MWSHDYCTVCDKQCSPGSMYCSDSCRLSEQSTSSVTSSDNIYSTLYYTSGRHNSLSHPTPSSGSTHANANAYSPALTTCSSVLSSPAQSIRSLEDSHKLSPLLLAQHDDDLDFTTHSSPKFTNTSLNYKRWLSSVA
ncbi:hypothetical protein DV451_002489 [Geotrichum candidum]|uniref:Uncharacterized protein n=1 Tax=Geotrichum candidum TaxID=1173061 RepID=A0A0J9XFG3_GEOCN|nr:hypothetical protein DV451_002489 [Geotrichum candidum]KAI9213269.1 hypothetical protein DS838_001840 [Geotrichum bryndzae]KAF5107786.1 hypothetical protein DV453_002813 [Geotrichum candidum]KAF5117160.1 hypothetical protein DV454_001313 [Geotrichum candidum]KAF5117193.1 hypothetical protein DV452_002397 [Geotrichum candidum]